LRDICAYMPGYLSNANTNGDDREDCPGGECG
jgi:hypothetical protein